MEKGRVVEGAEKLVEAALGGAILRLASEMPLANGSGGVAQRLHPRCHGGLVAAQADGVGDRVELVAKARRVAPGHEAGTRRTAIGRGDVAVGKAQSVLRDRVDVRGRDVLGKALRGEFAPAEVIGVKDDDVRWRGMR